jgi:hypothetical protein
MSKAGSTPTFAGPSCVRLVKAPALRRLPSGLLVEHARGRHRVSGFRLPRVPAPLRAMSHTPCRRAPGSARHGYDAALRCRYDWGDHWSTPRKVPVGSCRQPGPNTPSTASTPPPERGKVLLMCPVRSVTYVSGRSSAAVLEADRRKPFL